MKKKALKWIVIPLALFCAGFVAGSHLATRQAPGEIVPGKLEWEPISRDVSKIPEKEVRTELIYYDTAEPFLNFTLLHGNWIQGNAGLGLRTWSRKFRYRPRVYKNIVIGGLGCDNYLVIGGGMQYYRRIWDRFGIGGGIYASRSGLVATAGILYMF
ncbi:MAG: hypothetical protein GY757_09250 [bacterium]|nr:hypothetical protein [bacterium]